MKFLIDIVRAPQGAGTEVLHRVVVDEMKLQRVQFRAENLLAVWRRRGATGARISNHRGEELLSWDISLLVSDGSKTAPQTTLNNTPTERRKLA